MLNQVQNFQSLNYYCECGSTDRHYTEQRQNSSEMKHGSSSNLTDCNNAPKACEVLSTRPDFIRNRGTPLTESLEKGGLIPQSRLESNSNADLRALLDGLGVHLRRDGAQRLWPELVLDQRAGLARVVDAGLHKGERVQGMLGAEGEAVLVAREAVGQLCPDSCAGFLHNVVIGCSQAVSLVVPARIFQFKSLVGTSQRCTES